MDFAGDHHEHGGRVGVHARRNLLAGRGGVVGRVLFGIEDDLLGPVVRARMHLLEIGQTPQRAHRRLVHATLGLVDPPVFGGATATTRRLGERRRQREYAAASQRRDGACAHDFPTCCVTAFSGEKTAQRTAKIQFLCGRILQKRPYFTHFLQKRCRSLVQHHQPMLALRFAPMLRSGVGGRPS